ncbi:MAG: MFS transporter [Chloroflexi bacterium]|nr:MFS transporter [Chloroflexota bacterium]
MSAPGGRGPRLMSAAMLGVASGAILVPLNSTMLAVALPGVMDDFTLGANAVSSLVTLYLGAVAVALPVGGSIGDRYGHRPAFLIGVIAFAVASALAALATSFEILEVSRVGQAVSGALISTSSAALVRETAPPSRQGEAFGLFDLLVSTSAAVGPFIGGLLVGGFGWRSLFVLAVPLGIVSAAFVGLRLRPETAEETAASRRAANPIDVPGLVLLALAIVAFLVAIRSGSASGALGLVTALAVVPLLVLFVWVELRTDRPAVDPRLFLRRPFAAAVAGVFGATVILHGSFVIIPLLVEILLHESAVTSGIVLLGLAGVGAIVAPFGGRFSDRRGRRIVVVAGSTISAIGLAALWLGSGAATALSVAALLCVVGFGNGLVSPRQAAALESVEKSRVGMAAGTYYTGRYLGGVVGASLAGAILGTQVTAGGVATGFLVLALVGVAVTFVSFGLRGRNANAGAQLPA